MHCCPEYSDQLVDLSDGELPAEKRVAVAAHVVECPGCRAELARLDASLACLSGAFEEGRIARVGLHPKKCVAGPSSSQPWATAVIAASSISLLGMLWIGWRYARSSQPGAVVVDAPITIDQAAPPSKITPQDALWQIALIEQQARLQTSLDLMPDEPWYAEQRNENEHVLKSLREASTSATKLESGETL